jgi:hypothetical protein
MFHTYGDATIIDERLQFRSMQYARRSRPLKQGGPHLYRATTAIHGVSAFPVSSEGLSHLIAARNWMLMTHSNSDPHKSLSVEGIFIVPHLLWFAALKVFAVSSERWTLFHHLLQQVRDDEDLAWRSPMQRLSQIWDFSEKTKLSFCTQLHAQVYIFSNLNPEYLCIFSKPFADIKSVSWGQSLKFVNGCSPKAYPSPTPRGTLQMEIYKIS